MIICHNCLIVTPWHYNAVVYLSPSHATYLCVECSIVANPDNFRDLAPVYECKQCGISNEFYAHCFSCINAQMFWSMRNKKVGV